VPESENEHPADITNPMALYWWRGPFHPGDGVTSPGRFHSGTLCHSDATKRELSLLAVCASEARLFISASRLAGRGAAATAFGFSWLGAIFRYRERLHLQPRAIWCWSIRCR
jgi:hypothetical protein